MFYNILSRINFVKESFSQDQRGVTAVEYAIIAVAMSAIVLAVYTNGDLGQAMQDAMSTVADNINAAETVPTPDTSGGSGGTGG